MADKLSPSAQLQIIEIGEFLTKVARVNGLVEQYATTRSNPAVYELPVMRGFQQLKLQFMGAGWDALSQLCGACETAIRRGGSQHSKGKILREAVGSIKFQLEVAQRTIKSDDLAKQRRDNPEEEA